MKINFDVDFSLSSEVRMRHIIVFSRNVLCFSGPNNDGKNVKYMLILCRLACTTH